MAGSSKYLLIQERLGTPLHEQLRSWQKARVSAPAMARLLTQATKVELSSQAVRMWLRELSDHENGEAA